MPTRWRWPARPAFGAEQLIFLTDVDGVLDGGRQVRPLLTAAESEELIADGVATGGMQAKLNAALAALRGGVGRCALRPARPRTFWRGCWRGEAIGTRMVLSEGQAA